MKKETLDEIRIIITDEQIFKLYQILGDARISFSAAWKQIRNENIKKDFLNDVKVDALAKKYFLTQKQITRIVTE